MLARLSKDNEQAVVAAERALKADTTNTFYLEMAGETNLRVGRYDRAKQIFSRLIKDGQEPAYFRLLAILHNITKEPQKAIAVLDSAEVRFGRVEFFSRMRQQLLLENGEIEKAMIDAHEMVESAPYNPESHIMLANIFAEIKADSLAEVSFRNAIKLDRKRASTWFDYANFLDRNQRYGEMLLVWRTVIDLDDVTLSTKKQIVESITSKRDFYRQHFLLVEPIIRRMYELYPDDNQSADNYATHLIAASRTEEALEVFKRQIASKTPTEEQISRIIDIENYVDRPDSVAKYVDIALQHYPTKSNFWNIKAWLQMRKGENLAAINTLQSALDYAEDNISQSSLWGSIGDQHYELGDIKSSTAAYKKALTLNPDNAVVLNNYAYHLSEESKSLKKALEMALRANELSQNNATYLDTLAWIYYKLGLYEEAKKSMQQAISLDRDNSSELALHYGDILEALGNTFMAQTYWRKALERGADAAKIESRIEAQKLRLEREKTAK